MDYIGNYRSWITPEILNHLSLNDGDQVPVWQPERWTGHPLLEEYKERARPVYSNNGPVFHQFNPKSKDMQGFEVTLPVLPKTRKVTAWWFVKLLPGEQQAMHIDPHLIEVNNPVRYSLFLQDWEPGHIFVYDNTMLTGYKAGDVYEWSDPMCVHGVINTSNNIRYTLQITYYDEI